MSEKERPPYLTVGLHGVRDSKIAITLPEYLIGDGMIDGDRLEEDGYGCLVKFEGDFKGCWIPILRKGDTMKVEIFSEFKEKADVS